MPSPKHEAQMAKAVNRDPAASDCPEGEKMQLELGCAPIVPMGFRVSL